MYYFKEFDAIIWNFIAREDKIYCYILHVYSSTIHAVCLNEIS